MLFSIDLYAWVSLCVYLYIFVKDRIQTFFFKRSHAHNKTTNWIGIEWNAPETYLFSIEDHKWVHLHDIGFFPFSFKSVKMEYHAVW